MVHTAVWPSTGMLPYEYPTSSVPNGTLLQTLRKCLHLLASAPGDTHAREKPSPRGALDGASPSKKRHYQVIALTFRGGDFCPDKQERLALAWIYK